jgi:hypothetical protein
LHESAKIGVLMIAMAGFPQVAVETRARSHDLGRVRQEAEYF